MLQNIVLKITQIYKFHMVEKKNIFLNGLIDTVLLESGC